MIESKFRAALKEPLVHFLIAGLVLFIFFAFQEQEADPASRSITIDAQQVERLASGWSQTWQRSPTPAEMDGLIREHIKEEIYAREGLRLGLDKDDLIIRRRLRSKMEFLVESQMENAVPSEAALQAWLDRNSAKYDASKFSFDQIYLGEVGTAESIKSQLALGKDWQQLGTAISLPKAMSNQDAGQISREFGEDFAAALSKLPRGEWQGPIRSGFGMHLVRLRSAERGTKAKLSDVRQQVENDWRSATIEARKNQAYQVLLDGYTIKIAKP